MDLVLFLDCCKKISHICRILSQPRGNCLLVGVGGSGKQSVTKLSSFVCEMETTCVEISKNYRMLDFDAFLISMFKEIGLTSKPGVFLLNETQIVFEQQVEYINNVLNTGEVPNLFEKDKTGAKDQILKEMQEIAKESGFFGDPWNFFIQRLRAGLHIVLAMSPVGEKFRVRTVMFPSLVNCCTIDWFLPWNPEALLMVANNKFETLKLGLDDTKQELDMKNKIISVCPFVHNTVRE